MAEIKDKSVTVEGLAALHTHNQNTYMTKSNPTGTGTMTMTGDGSFSGVVNVGSLMIGSNVKLISTENSLEIIFVDEEG